MKFTAAVLASLVSVASARISLTGAVKKQEKETYDARIIIGGLHHDATNGDLKTIGKSAVAAYNAVYSDVGFSIGGIKTQSSIPADTMSWTNGNELEGDYSTTDDFGCNLCRPDDDQLSSTEVIFVGVDWYNQGMKPLLKNVDDVQLRNAFEDVFCANLRASGASSLVDAKDCSFSFMEKPTRSKLSPAKSAYAASAKGAQTEVQATMSGILRDFSDADRELINKSIVDAHNEAFSGTGYSLKAFKVVGDVDIPTLGGGNKLEGDYSMTDDFGCNLCAPDDDFANTVTLVTGVAVAAAKKSGNAKLQGDYSTTDDFGCNLCAPDDDFKGESSAAKLEYFHEAFEKSFCNKLQASGSANFANVHACSFRFVDTPTADAKNAAALAIN